MTVERPRHVSRIGLAAMQRRRPRNVASTSDLHLGSVGVGSVLNVEGALWRTGVGREAPPTVGAHHDLLLKIESKQLLKLGGISMIRIQFGS
jgi:hypothetical protein